MIEIPKEIAELHRGTAKWYKMVPEVMNMKTLIVALVMMSASSASAQTPLSMFAAGAAADWTSTGYALNRGFNEGNSLINWTNSPTATVAMGVAIDAAGAYAWMRATKDHRKIQAIGFYAATAFRVYLTARNVAIVNRNGGRVH